MPANLCNDRSTTQQSEDQKWKEKGKEKVTLPVCEGMIPNSLILY
jgi:hypothetical protein